LKLQKGDKDDELKKYPKYCQNIQIQIFRRGTLQSLSTIDSYRAWCFSDSYRYFTGLKEYHYYLYRATQEPTEKTFYPTKLWWINVEKGSVKRNAIISV